jgi:hypothetical protein
MIILPNGVVVPPTTTCVAPGASEIGVPDTVIAGAPGISVWVPMTKSDWAFAVMVCPLIVSWAGAVGADPPRTIAVPAGGREIVAPFTVMAEPPGESVCEPTMNIEELPGAGVRTVLAMAMGTPATIGIVVDGCTCAGAGPGPGPGELIGCAGLDGGGLTG